MDPLESPGASPRSKDELLGADTNATQPRKPSKSKASPRPLVLSDEDKRFFNVSGEGWSWKEAGSMLSPRIQHAKDSVKKKATRVLPKSQRPTLAVAPNGKRRAGRRSSFGRRNSARRVSVSPDAGGGTTAERTPHMTPPPRRRSSTASTRSTRSAASGVTPPRRSSVKKHTPTREQFFADTPIRGEGRSNSVSVVAKAPESSWSNYADIMTCQEGPEGGMTACLCPCVLSASALTAYDESPWELNALCVSPCMVRNIIRHGYNIPGSSLSDCAMGLFCGPCVASQALSEVEKRGPLAYQFMTTRAINTTSWLNTSFGIFNDSTNCAAGFFCAPCSIAYARTQYDGSGFCFNLMCMTSPVILSVMRNGWNLEGDGLRDSLYGLFCTECAAYQLLNEVKERGACNHKVVQIVQGPGQMEMHDRV